MIASLDGRNHSKAMLFYAGTVITLWWGSLDALDYGGDIMNYYNNASTALICDYSTFLSLCPFERGYATLIWGTTHLFGNAQALLFIQFIWVTTAVFIFIYYNSKNVLLSLVYYVCMGGFMFYLTAFRQSFAAAFGFYALMLAKNKHLMLAIAVILAGSLFHQTLVVFFPVILLSQVKICKKNILICSVIVFIASFFLNQIILSANKYFGMDYGPDYIFSTVVGGIINLSIMAMAFVFLYFVYGNTKDEAKRQRLNSISPIIYMGMVGIIVYGLRFHVLALERIAYYFIPAFCILMPEGIVGMSSGKTENVIPRILFVVLAIVLFWVRCNHTFGPYNSIWFQGW